jgi:hypothetical protein
VKLTGPLLLKEFPEFYEIRRLLPHSQKPATCPYHEPDRSSPCPPHPPPRHPKSRKSILILSSNQTSELFKWSLSLRFPHQYHLCTSAFPIRAIYPTQLILLDLVTRIMNDEDHREESSSLCSLLHSHVFRPKVQ